MVVIECACWHTHVGRTRAIQRNRTQRHIPTGDPVVDGYDKLGDPSPAVVHGPSMVLSLAALLREPVNHELTTVLDGLTVQFQSTLAHIFDEVKMD